MCLTIGTPPLKTGRCTYSFRPAKYLSGTIAFEFRFARLYINNGDMADGIEYASNPGDLDRGTVIGREVRTGEDAATVTNHGTTQVHDRCRKYSNWSKCAYREWGV